MRALYLTGFAIIGLTGCSGGGMTDVNLGKTRRLR